MLSNKSFSIFIISPKDFLPSREYSPPFLIEPESNKEFTSCPSAEFILIISPLLIANFEESIGFIIVLSPVDKILSTDIFDRSANGVTPSANLIRSSRVSSGFISYIAGLITSPIIEALDFKPSTKTESPSFRTKSDD